MKSSEGYIFAFTLGQQKAIKFLNERPKTYQQLSQCN